MTGPAVGRAPSRIDLCLLCARQELLLAVRSRWTQIFAIVFAALAVAVASSGYILSGGSGVQDFSRTSVSLVQLVLLLVPLSSLLIGVLSLAPERGAAEILFSQPVSRRDVLLGQCLGLFAALVAAEAIGFGGAGLAIFSNAGGEGALGFLLLFLSSTLLTAVFLALFAFVALYERKQPTSEERAAQAKRFLEIKADDVIGILIERPDLPKGELQRGAGDRWRVEADPPGRADAFSVDGLLADLGQRLNALLPHPAGARAPLAVGDVGEEIALQHVRGCE